MNEEQILALREIIGRADSGCFNCSQALASDWNELAPSGSPLLAMTQEAADKSYASGAEHVMVVGVKP